MALGILETEILRMDVGLGDIDPKRLATGEWDECLYISELICWIGRRIGLLRPRRLGSSQAPTEGPHSPRALRPSMSPPSKRIICDSPCSGSSRVMGAQPDYIESDYSHHSDELSALSIFDDEPKSSTAPSCIHAIPTPSPHQSFDEFRLSASSDVSERQWVASSNGNTSTGFAPVGLCDCDPSIVDTLPLEHDHCRRRTRIRKKGNLHCVDDEAEIAAFERSRSMGSIPSFLAQSTDESLISDEMSVKAINEEYARTVRLLNERAALLAQLASLES